MSSYFSLFKAYDIRGTYPEINAKVYYWVGRGLMEKIFIPENLSKNFVITRDCRYTSPEFYKALVAGVIDGGGTPLCLDLGSTDFLYAATQFTGFPGASLTASHNPKDDNGLKIVKGGSTMLGLENGLDVVRDYVLSKIDTEEIDPSKFPEPKTDDSLKAQVSQYFLTKIREIGQVEIVNNQLKKEGKKLKIAVDCGNGMGGFVMELIKNLYSEVEFVPLYWDLDGNYPNHPADPQKVENMKDLQKVVTDQKLDFGFAFDGDADRVFFVDEKGELVQGDFLVAFFTRNLLKAYYENPKPNLEPAVVYIQPGSRCIPEAILESDGIGVPSKQGHTYIKATMQKYKAVYGGEFSGHHYFAEFGNMDSGVLAASLMIKSLVLANKQVSEVFSDLNRSYFISELEVIKLKEGTTFEDIKSKLKKAFPDANYSYYDGMSVFYPDWKFSIRPSNTEPVVKMILETRGQDLVKEKLKEVYAALGE